MVYLGIKKSILKLGVVLTIALQCMTVYGEIFVDNISYVCQMPELPTGCEITALEILMRQSGFNVTKEELARKVKKASTPRWTKDGVYGEHPKDYFIGDPFSKHSYGVYAPCIMDLMSEYMPRQQIQDLCGSDFSVLEGVVKSGRPVMLWSTVGQSEPKTGATWVTPSGEKFTWVSGEHALVLIGFNDKYVWTSDPAKGVLRKFPKARFIELYKKLGKQAIAIYKEPVKYENKALQVNDILQTQECLKDLVDGRIWVPLKTLQGVVNNLIISYNAPTKEVLLRTSLNGLETFISHKGGKTYKNGEPYDIGFMQLKGVSYVSTSWLQSFYGLDCVETEKSIVIKN